MFTWQSGEIEEAQRRGDGQSAPTLASSGQCSRVIIASVNDKQLKKMTAIDAQENDHH
jgi:hypothetical protein